MINSRRKKILFYLLLVILFLGIFGYIFRYTIAFRFQYARIHSLKCQSVAGNQNCLQRLWAHRINSLQRYDWLQDKFQGFESDIVFDDSSKTFSVYHPPLPPAGDTLSFTRYLSHVDLISRRFWLDTRNVKDHNAAAALLALRATGKEAQLKRSCIIELYNLGAAQQFAAAGYQVSIDMMAIWPNRMENEPAYRDSVNRLLQNVRYVSQESSQLALMKQMFPAKRIITWHLYFKDYFRLNRIQKLLDDPQVDIILLNIKSPYFR